MYDDLFVGMTIYHKTGKTQAIITEIDHNNINIELSKEIACKKKLTLPITHFGEWIFFKEDDVELSSEILANKSEYLKYNNRKILDAYRDNIEQKKKIEAEEKRKALELAKQQEIELQRQRKLQEELKLEIQSKENFVNMLKVNYQFEGFHHYTDITNLFEIIRTGKLLSRNKAIELGFTDAADHDVLSRTYRYIMDYVRFYYKENTPTIYRNEGIKLNNESPHMPIPVLMIFNENIIYHQKVAFLSGGGGNSNSKFTKNISIAANFDWNLIFYRGPIPRGENSIVSVGNDTSGASITNKKNAEFLYPTEIEIKNIKKIIFRSPADKKVAEIILGENNLFLIDNDRKKFNYKHNFLYDYELTQKGNDFLVALIFDRDFEDYTHELCVYYHDRTKEKLSINNLSQSRRIDLHKPTGYENFDYYFILKTLRDKRAKRIEYLMNGHLSALWEERKYD